MKHALTKWSLILGTLFVIGPMACGLTSMLRGPDGGPHATMLTSSSLAGGLGAGVMVLALAVGAGVVLSRMVTQGWGLFGAGMVLAWASWGTATIDEIVRVRPAAGTLWALAVEGLIFAPLLAAGVWVILEAHKPSAAADRPRPAWETTTNPWAVDVGFGAVALVLAALAAWWVAQNTLKGQAVMAASAGGLFAGIAASAAPSASLHRPRTLVLVAGVAAMAVVGPAIGAMLTSTGAGLAVAANGGTLFPAARMVPLDWLAGALMGVPVGLTFFGSIIEAPSPSRA